MPPPPKHATYRKAIVTFIDILGFGAMLETASATDVAKALRKMYFAGDAHEPADENASRGFHVLAFSDSIVRTRDMAQVPGAFFAELLSLVHMQAQVTDLGVFIRGGMSFGDVYADGTTVFGPAMACAYRLESKHASSPRIVVDPDLLRAFDRGDLPMENDLVEEASYINSLLVRDSDYAWVDYLRAIRHELDEPSEYRDVLKRHAANIAKNFDRSASDGVRTKGEWVANYHNCVVDELCPETLRELGVRIEDLRLDNVPQRFQP